MKSSHTNLSDAISLIEEYVTQGYASFSLERYEGMSAVVCVGMMLMSH